MLKNNRIKFEYLKNLLNSFSKEDFLNSWWANESNKSHDDLKSFLNNDFSLPTFVEYLGKAILMKNNHISLLSKSSKSSIQGFDGMYLIGEFDNFFLFPYEAKSTKKSTITQKSMIDRAISDFYDMSSSHKVSQVETIEAVAKARALVDLSAAKRVDISPDDFSRIIKTIKNILDNSKNSDNHIVSINSMLSNKDHEINVMVKTKHKDVVNLSSIIFELSLKKFGELFLIMKARCFDEFSW